MQPTWATPCITLAALGRRSGPLISGSVYRRMSTSAGSAGRHQWVRFGLSPLFCFWFWFCFVSFLVYPLVLFICSFCFCFCFCFCCPSPFSCFALFRFLLLLFFLFLFLFLFIVPFPSFSVLLFLFLFHSACRLPFVLDVVVYRFGLTLFVTTVFDGFFAVLLSPSCYGLVCHTASYLPGWSRVDLPAQANFLRCARIATRQLDPFQAQWPHDKQTKQAAG